MINICAYAEKVVYAICFNFEEMTKKKNKSMAEVSAEYEEFIKKQKLKNNKANQFEKAIKKAVQTKPHGSK